MDSEKKPLGRPPRGIKPQTERLYVRAVDDDKALIANAAEAAGMSLSEWIRSRLVLVAKQELKKGGHV
jgi:uncharacterized protein (DUF1778 family)